MRTLFQMETCKILISRGILRPLPNDCGTLLRVITSECEDVAKVVGRSLRYESSFVFPCGTCISIEYDSMIFPFFRLRTSKAEFIGYAVLFANGVGRTLLLANASAEYDVIFSRLFTPCMCRAGHLLVQRFRVGEDRIHCTCENSTLKCMEDSMRMTHSCPITYGPKIPFRVLQNYALATIAQRARISLPR